MPNCQRQIAKTAKPSLFQLPEALASVDPQNKSQFDVEVALDALLATIAFRADDLRIAALEAIAHTAAPSRINQVTDVYQELDRAGQLDDKDDVRVAFLYAIGNLDATTDASVEIIKAAMKHPSRERSTRGTYRCRSRWRSFPRRSP